MEVSQTLFYAALLLQVLLVVITIYLYYRNRLRLFLFLSLGFLALLAASLLSLAMPDVDTSLYTNLLQAGAMLFFVAGVLSTV